MNPGLTKWRPIQPFRVPDKIVSSDARIRKDVVGFAPTYENDVNVNMYFIMGNEYMRLWFEERKVYEKIAYAQQESQKRERQVSRPFVPRYNKFKKIIDEEEDEKLSIKERLKATIKTYPVRKNVAALKRANKKPQS